MEFENHILRRIKNVASPPWSVTRITDAMCNNKFFISLVATIAEMKTEMAVDVEWEREEWRLKFTEAMYSTGALSASSSDRPQTDISDEWTNKNAKAVISEEPSPEVPPWSAVVVCSKSSRYTTKTKRELDVLGLWVVEAINKRFVATSIINITAYWRTSLEITTRWDATCLKFPGRSRWKQRTALTPWRTWCPQSKFWENSSLYVMNAEFIRARWCSSSIITVQVRLEQH